ncbi:AsmA family protein, partial [Stenotrophomonas maltophilia]
MNAAASPAATRACRWRLRRPGPRGRRWLTVLVFLLAVILVVIALWDWNWFKGPVERAVHARTGRALHIGHLDVDLGRTSTIRADAITFANAAWAKQPNMATADRVEIDVRVWPLLRGS